MFEFLKQKKDIIFENSLKMTEYADYAQSNPVVQRFLWHMVNHMSWDAIIFMLSEMRHRGDPEEKSKVWKLIGKVYSRHVKDMGKKGPTPLHIAIQNLMLKAWRAYTEECNFNHRTAAPCPSIVMDFLANTSGDPDAQSKNVANTHVAEHCDESQDQYSHDFLVPQFGPEADNLEFLLGDTPKDWNEWDDLLGRFQV